MPWNGLCRPFEREAGACVVVRLRFVGDWTVSDTCNASGTDMYNVQIALDPAVPDGLLISGFWNAFLAPVSATLSGDAITIDWVPGTATVLTVKGEVQGEPFKEPEFFNALLGIWLGPHPADEQLKHALLGTAAP